MLFTKYITKTSNFINQYNQVNIQTILNKKLNYKFKEISKFSIGNYKKFYYKSRKIR